MSDILFIIAEVKQYLVLSKSNQINVLNTSNNTSNLRKTTHVLVFCCSSYYFYNIPIKFETSP